MTAGFYSPMPPARTGVADYSAALLAALRAAGREVRAGAPGDVNLYHLGNNGLHREIYRRALERPGVVVLHDAVLNHFMLGTLSREEYISEFVHNYGAWYEELAARLWAGRAKSGVDPNYFRYPMLKRVVESAGAVVVHNAGAARMAREHGATRIAEIPHLFEPHPLPSAYEVLRLRQSMGVGPRVCLFGVFGHLRESKRLTAVLRAFENVSSSGVSAALLVAGQFVSSDLERAVGPLLRRPGIIRVGYTPEEEFRRYAAAVDVGVNLRFPPAGESSGIAIRLMGIGKPVIVTGGEETVSFPGSACLKVDAGVSEMGMLTDYMRWLAASPKDAREIGARAAACIAARHHPASVASAYWGVLESVA
jgi:glycosyltransferase involved in cell wall biosynthesis